jgi:DNA-binding NtrC family response regulator
MVQYVWPGNVRELKNVIERAMILTDQEVITPKHLPFELKQTEKMVRENRGEEISETTMDLTDMSLESMEKTHLSKVLKKLEWNKSKASKFLGISRATLRAKIKKYNIADN